MIIFSYVALIITTFCLIASTALLILQINRQRRGRNQLLKAAREAARSSRELLRETRKLKNSIKGDE